MAGGLKEGADETNIYVSRRSVDGSYNTLSEVFTVSSALNLEINNGKVFYLQPFDRVVVRYSKGYSTQKSVSIEGEVAFPGAYSIQNKNDRISDLIEQSGGLTSFAFPEGATLIRKVGASKENLKILKNSTDSLTQKELMDYNIEKVVAINLIEILKNKKSEIDLLLREGDRLRIPDKLQTVEITGEVYVPSLVQFQPGKSLRYYISNAGGFKPDAKSNSVAVQYMNGEIRTVKQFLFFKSYPKIEPGAKILVPQRPEKSKISTQEIIGITTSLATLGILIQTLTR